MNGYVCFYSGKRWECHAESSYKASQLAIAYFKPPRSKQHMVSVILAEKGGEEVLHDGAGL